MPVILSTLIILIAALGGFLLSVLFTRILFRPHSPKKIIGFPVQGILPAMIPALASHISEKIEADFFSAEKIEAKLSDPLLMQQLKPEIEKHVDVFLKTKLKEAFPLLSNFMGEKTLAKFKEAFLNEVETILPMLLKSYADSLLKTIQPGVVIAEKLNGLRVDKLEKLMREHTSKHIMQFRIIALLLGAFIGVLQVILIYLF
ncbi:MAG: hypothetical protein EOP53_07950 [Sphingobacteriales bacterium]|nr:MAG: hypothetical protein EOP53_07950 [Sphingobacteriales bacterium]